MTDKPYMGGRGIMERTEQLNARMFITLPLAVLGALLIVIAGGSEASTVLRVVGCVIGAAGVFSWLAAGYAVHKHTRALEREVRRRGKGWAES